MALESWRVTFLRVGIPIRNHNIVWTIQSQKPLKVEPNFFPDAQNAGVLSVLLSTHAARQKPFHSLLQDMATARRLRNGVGIHCQHNEAPQVGGLLRLAEERH
jgi:hypothetical protein